MKKTTKKVLVLSMAMAAMMALPTMSVAQNMMDNGLFGRGSESASKNTSAMLNRNGSRSNESFNITNQQFGQDVPLGSGIAILLVAGAGYVALKKKED